MLNFIYRTNGGEVIGSSTQPPIGTEPFLSVATDPLTPDGTDLAIRKIHVSGTVRNATQSEIDNFAVAEAADNVIAARLTAKTLFDNSTTGKLFRAFASILVDEINTLRGQHSLAPRTLAQLRTAILNRIDSGTVD